MNLEIASRLVALRKENCLSQEALAEKLGISRQAVSKWERAEASPDTDNLIALAKLYHVSLDELLRIHEEEEIGTADSGGFRQGTGYEQEYDGTAEKSANQQEPNDEDEVHIGFQGIHVRERGGDEVHIGWDGIHVHDKDNEVHIDRHGIYVNGEEAGGHIFTRGRSGTEFPLFLLAIVIHITLGFCFGFWWTAWLVYLLIPVISSFIQAVRCRNPYVFAYPVFVTFIFLYLGMVHDIWHPAWIVFLTIPLYYSFWGYIRSRREDDEET